MYIELQMSMFFASIGSISSIKNTPYNRKLPIVSYPGPSHKKRERAWHRLFVHAPFSQKIWESIYSWYTYSSIYFYGFEMEIFLFLFCLPLSMWQVMFYGKACRKHVKNLAHAHAMCTRPSLFLWEGPGYEARSYLACSHTIGNNYIQNKQIL